MQTVEKTGGKVIVELTADPIAPEFGPEPGEADGTRTYFDDVDDYDGWSASPPQAKDGTVLKDYDGWTRKVEVVYATPSDPGISPVTDLGLKRISVTVTDLPGQESVLAALRSNMGTYSQSPSVRTTRVNWIGLNLQIGAGG